MPPTSRRLGCGPLSKGVFTNSLGNSGNGKSKVPLTVIEPHATTRPKSLLGLVLNGYLKVKGRLWPFPFSLRDIGELDTSLRMRAVSGDEAIEKLQLLS